LTVAFFVRMLVFIFIIFYMYIFIRRLGRRKQARKQTTTVFAL